MTTKYEQPPKRVTFLLYWSPPTESYTAFSLPMPFASSSLKMLRFLLNHGGMHTTWSIVLFKAPTTWTPCTPFLKSLWSLPSVLFHPLLRYFRQSHPTLTKISLAIIRPTTISWFKQISKGQIYQVNRSPLWGIFTFIFRQFRMTFFDKIM